MKKFILFILAIVGLSLTAFAVPSGLYKDSAGKMVLVTDSQNLYRLDSEGNVTQRYKITNESSNGSFQLLKLDDNDNIIPGLYPINYNGWWEERGNIYMNTSFGSRTFTRQ